MHTCQCQNPRKNWHLLRCSPPSNFKNPCSRHLVRVAPECNRSYCEDSFSGYSGSVWGWYTCWGVSTPCSKLGLRMVKELDLRLALGMKEKRKTGSLHVYVIVHRWGVGGSNLGQTQSWTCLFNFVRSFPLHVEHLMEGFISLSVPL